MGRGSSFLYAHGRLGLSPGLLRPVRSFSRHDSWVHVRKPFTRRQDDTRFSVVSPAEQPVFSAKKGAFRLLRPPYRPFCPPERHVFCRNCLEKPRLLPEIPAPGRAGFPDVPVCAAFHPAFSCWCAARTVPLFPKNRPLCAAFPPVVAVCCPKVSQSTPPRHSLGAEDIRLRRSAFALRHGEVCTPRGDQIPVFDILETAGQSRVNFREIRYPGYQTQKQEKRRFRR